MCSSRRMRREQEFAALSDIAEILAERSGQARTLGEILKVLAERLELRRGTVMLRTPDGTGADIAAVCDAEGMDFGGGGGRYRLGEGITGRVLETGQPVIVPRIVDEPEFRDRIHDRFNRGGELLS